MSDSPKIPYLSIVISSRNDERAGSSLRPMQVSIGGLLEQLEKYCIESELILVDWNPPPDKPLLKDVFPWPARQLKYCTMRVIVVPTAIHQRYEGADKIPMNRGLATNCGIRRARGEFILPGSIDALYPDELMSYIAPKSLKRDEEYRVDRYDVDRNVVQLNTLEQQLDYCQKHIIQVHSQTPPSNQSARRNRRGLPELHTMAAGDFQLLSRHYWHLLRGYREGSVISAYGDGLLCYMAYAAGVRQVVLNNPMRVYHIDHDNKFNDALIREKLPLQNWLSVPFLSAWFNTRLLGVYRRCLMLFGYKMKSSVSGVPTLDFSEYWKMCQDMLAGKRSYIINGEDWGLG